MSSESMHMFPDLRTGLRAMHHPDAEKNRSKRLPKTFKVMKWMESRREPVPPMVMSLYRTNHGGHCAALTIELPDRPTLVATATDESGSARGFVNALEAACTEIVTLLPR
jgi:hypothetical protein